MATLTLLVFFFGWNTFIPIQNQVIFSAIASSTFLTFISTGIYDSLSKKIIGGQIIGILVGIGLWISMHYFYKQFPANHNEIFMVFISLSARVSLFFMAIVNLEHPPTAGTAMAFVLKPESPILSDVMFVVVCASLLAITHKLLKKYQLLKDLEGRDGRTKMLGKLPKVSGFLQNSNKNNNN